VGNGDPNFLPMIQIEDFPDIFEQAGKGIAMVVF
jgi:hypothetical protein